MAERERRNLSGERQAEILEAFKRCITEYGIEKSSLRCVAREAGVTQPLLSHHFGSRAGLIEALVHYVLSEYDEALERGLESVSEQDDAEVLLTYLFGGRFSKFTERDDVLFFELYAAASRDVAIRTQIGELYARSQRSVTNYLRKIYPDASATECRSVSYGLMCLAESNESFRTFELPGRRSRDAIASGRALIDSLLR